MGRHSLPKRKWPKYFDALKKRKQMVALFFLLILLFFTMWGAWRYSETPSFCGLCHNMEIYVNSWKTSSHRDVACIKCHYESGFGNHLRAKFTDIQLGLAYIITGRGIERLHHEVKDTNCLRSGCHAKADIRENMIFKNVAFNHSRHLEELRRGKRLRCNTCHDQIVQGAHLKVTEVDCFICHFYKAGSQGEAECLSCSECGSCHIQPKGDIPIKGISFNHKRYIERGVSCLECHVGINKGDGHVPENKCLECHQGHQLRNATFTSEFLHQRHVTDRKIECYRCHTEIKHELGGIPTIAQFMESCGQCHTKQVHLGPREMYMGTGGIGVADSPNKMFSIRVDCAGCHKTQEESEAALYTSKYLERSLAKACVKCHGEGYDEMLFHWKGLLVTAGNEVNSRLFSVQRKLYEAEKRGVEKHRIKKAQNLINEARHNYTFSLMGKGVHNIEYALKLLNHAKNNTEEALALMEKGYRPKEYPTQYTCTGLCHVGLGERFVSFNEIHFPHEPHVGMDLQCLECHSPREKHGETYLKNCAECHHGEGTGEVMCGDCHLSVKRLFYGKTGIDVQDLPSIKADVVECVDCHRSIVEGIRESFTAIKTKCIKCHDESYGEMAEKWKAATDELLKRTLPRLKEIKNHIRRLEKQGKPTFVFTKLFGDAEYNVNLVIEGKGVHNVEYSEELIGAAMKKLDQVEPMLRKKK